MGMKMITTLDARHVRALPRRSFLPRECDERAILTRAWAAQRKNANAIGALLPPAGLWRTAR
jgi:hypothetical protein